MFTPKPLHTLLLLLGFNALCCLQPPKTGLQASTHGARLKVAFLEAPLLPVEAIVRDVLLHHLVLGVEQHVTGRTRCRVLHVVHCEKRREEPQVKQKQREASLMQDALVVPTYVYNRRTGGSDTWWPQTSPRRSLRCSASGGPRIPPHTSAPRRTDLGEGGGVKTKGELVPL